VDEGSLGAGAACGLEHVQCANGIGVEVFEGYRCRPVMAGLGGGVDDGVGPDLSNKVEDTLSVADVELVVDEALEILLEALLIPAGVSLRAKEDRALIVIDSVDLVSKFIGKVVTNLRADEARRTCDEEFFSDCRTE